MTPDDLQDFRVARLAELLEKKFAGQKVGLGRALGHKSGAFVRQLLDRERPITEKTVQAIEDLPGCAGWFTPVVSPPLLQAAMSEARARVAKELSRDGSLSELSLRALSLARRFDGLTNEEHQRIAYALMDNTLQQFESPPPAQPRATREPKRSPGRGH